MKPYLRSFLSSLCTVVLTLLAFSAYKNFQNSRTPEQADAGLIASFEEALFPGVFAGFGSTSMTPWANYTSWANSTGFAASDTMMQSLYIMNTNNTTRHTLTDFNGDGLVDILYHYWGNSYPSYYMVLLNTGDMGFDLAYKCVREGSPIKYYGDCADV